MYIGTIIKVLAGIGAIVAAFFLFKYKQQVRKFIEEVLSELKKVNWTPRQDLINATLVVIVSAICLGVIITLTDLLVSRTLNFILSR